LSSCATVPWERRGQIAEAYTEVSQIENFVPQWQDLYNGIAFSAGRIKAPRLEFWALRVDLRSKNIEIVVNDAGPDENSYFGSLPALTVSGFTAKYNCIAAMNAGPFSPVSSKVGEKRDLTGVFVSSGRLISPPHPRYDCLLIYDEGYAAVLTQRKIRDFTGIRHAIGGFYTVLNDGRLTERAAASKKRHPRSAVAVSTDGFTMYMLVIDGRRYGSIGGTERETGLLLRALGAENGLLMDGGGSSALALGIGGKIQLMNKPIHQGIIGHERAVATCIGIRRTEQH
jgi:exopolysaccharide biosynthesis protein